MEEKSYLAITALLGVLNVDEDGDYFICKEAEDIVENLRNLVLEYESDRG